MDKLFPTPPNDESSSSGINPYELPNMPIEQRKILQLILRKREVSFSDLMDYIDTLPENERMDATRLDQTLEQLSQGKHIICVVEGEETTYKANMRLKSGRNVMLKGIWDVLDSANEKADGSEQRRKTNNMASTLFAALDGDKKPKAEDDDLDSGTNPS